MDESPSAPETHPPPADPSEPPRAEPLAEAPPDLPDDTEGRDAGDDGDATPLWKPTPSKVLLIAANLVPLYGVLLLDWDAFAVVFLYWLENVTVGVFAALRMAFCLRPEPFKWLQKALMIPFFMMHYGGFAAGHGFFVFVLFGAFGEGGGGVPDDLSVGLLWSIVRARSLFLPAAILAGSHAFSFVSNYLIKGECRRTFLIQEMARPYRRVVILHIAIIGGGFLIQMLGAPALMLALLVLLKTGMDLYTHSRVHRRAQSQQRRKLERAYRLFESFRRSAATADAEGGATDSLQARFPGYVRDRTAEKWHRRPCAWLTFGGMIAGVVGGITLALGAGVLGGVVLGTGVAAFIVGVVLYNIRQRLPCSVCGRPMEVVETSVTPAEMTAVERLSTLKGTVSARQRWLVCHPCKRYWLTWRSVQGGD